jgi:Zn-dependent M28 family amino/carboxypeptidase
MRAFTAALILIIALKVTAAEPALAQATSDNSQILKRAEASITQPHLLQHIKELSSDAYIGRAPGTEGETKTVAYIISQCRAIGLQPGSPDGTWTQKVPLWGMLTQGVISLKANGKEIPLVSGRDYVAGSTMPVPRVNLSNSGLVFVGYGVTAPVYHWDDYAGMDVHGKTVVILTGDPPVVDSKDPSKLDEKMFLGRALTIYGRTGTKLEVAYKHGAAAVILVSPTPQALASLFQNFTREDLIIREPHDRDRVKAQAILGAPGASKLFSAAGTDFEALRAAAAKPGFRAVALSGTASFNITTRVRQIDSANVIAKISGSDPQLKNQYVIYSGHWDHHGKVGNDIFHGASDNAAGTAGVLELARAFHSMHPSPRRTILFLWPTAEEKGLVGALYYVEHPLYPLQQTVANINLDYFSNWGWGRTHDFSIVGIGNSSLDDLTKTVVNAQGRVLTGDTAPEQGFYFRSDHYEFTRVGVPSLETSPGIDYIGKPASFGIQKRAEYISHDYHQPSDVIKPGWDLSGAVEDLQVLLDVGYRVAQDDARPVWKPNAIWRPWPEGSNAD